jgi:hypothetical protein
MGFDPGELFDEYDEDGGEGYEEGYDGGHVDGYEEGFDNGEEAELSSDDGPDFDAVDMATAAGFGYHMSQDEINERRIAEEILRKRDKAQGKPVAVPLWERHGTESKGKTTPFGRWAAKVNQDPSLRDKLKIEYTKEEQLKMIRAEGEGHD